MAPQEHNTKNTGDGEQRVPRPEQGLNPDRDSPEAQLLPYTRAIEWDSHPRELAMIKRQLEFIAEVQRGEHDRS